MSDRSLWSPERTISFAFLPAGYPSLAVSVEASCIMAENGADVIVLGFPFSDPLVDGPMIQRAYARSLDGGTTLNMCWQLVETICSSVGRVIVRVYHNQVLAYGYDRFCADCSCAGVYGVRVVDVSLSKTGELERSILDHGLEPIYEARPDSSEQELKQIAKRDRGIIYMVSGSEAEPDLPQGLPVAVERIRGMTGRPVCVGSVISTAEQVASLSQFIDGILITSEIITLLDSGIKWRVNLGQFIRSVRDASWR